MKKRLIIILIAGTAMGLILSTISFEGLGVQQSLWGVGPTITSGEVPDDLSDGEGLISYNLCQIVNNDEVTFIHRGIPMVTMVQNDPACGAGGTSFYPISFMINCLTSIAVVYGVFWLMDKMKKGKTNG